MRLARAHDDDASDQERAFRRLATPVAKYWVCKRGPGHAYEALECLGGNGYTESFPLARRYREQPVMALWEGSGNVIALDALRAIAREPRSVSTRSRRRSGSAGRASVVRCAPRGDPPSFCARWPGRMPVHAAWMARRLVEQVALARRASPGRGHGVAVSEAFIRADWGTSTGISTVTCPVKSPLGPYSLAALPIRDCHVWAAASAITLRGSSVNPGLARKGPWPSR